MRVSNEYQTHREAVVADGIGDTDFQPDWEDWIDNAED